MREVPWSLTLKRSLCTQNNFNLPKEIWITYGTLKNITGISASPQSYFIRISWSQSLNASIFEDPGETFKKFQHSDCHCVEVKWSESWSIMANSLQPYGLHSPWNSLGQNTRVGSLSLLQRIFPTQELNRGLLHCRWILDQLSYQVKWMLWEFHLNNNKTGRKFKTNFFQRHVSFGNRDK